MVLSLEGAELVQGSRRVQLGHLRGTGPFLPRVGVASETVEWIVRELGPGAHVQVSGESDQAGQVRSAWVALR